MAAQFGQPVEGLSPLQIPDALARIVGLARQFLEFCSALLGRNRGAVVFSHIGRQAEGAESPICSGAVLRLLQSGLRGTGAPFRGRPG